MSFKGLQCRAQIGQTLFLDIKFPIQFDFINSNTLVTKWQLLINVLILKLNLQIFHDREIHDSFRKNVAASENFIINNQMKILSHS